MGKKKLKIRQRPARHYTVKRDLTKGNPPDWINDKEVVAMISDCTNILRADVKDVLDCYFILLYEAVMDGFRVNFPEIGYFENTYVPSRDGEIVGRDGNKIPYHVEEHNKPVFKFYSSFKKEMISRTTSNPYKLYTKVEYYSSDVKKQVEAEEEDDDE